MWLTACFLALGLEGRCKYFLWIGYDLRVFSGIPIVDILQNFFPKTTRTIGGSKMGGGARDARP